MTQTDAALSLLPNHWQLQVRLRCGSLCGHPMPPRLRAQLMQLRDVSLLELYVFLAGGKVPLLRRIVRTENQRTRVTQAYRAFYTALLRSRRRGRVPSDRVAWIVPDAYLTSSSRVGPRRTQLVAEIRRQLGPAAARAGDTLDWLPWTSLGIVTCLRRWRTPRIGAIRRALFKLAHDFANGRDASLPWEPRFSRDMGIIPLQALYQYESTRLLEDSLRRFEELDLTCVNDLRFLHPSAVTTAKEAGQPLLRLYQALQRHL